MGSTTIAALIIIAVHLLVCMTLCLLHHVGVLKVDGLLLPFMALIPLWGPLSVALMHSRAVLRGGRRIPAGLQELKVEDQEQRNILVDDRTDYANTVPLEEALIVDNPRQRRNLMLSILNENPGQYANLLSQARLNEDVEVVALRGHGHGADQREGRHRVAATHGGIRAEPRFGRGARPVP